MEKGNNFSTTVSLGVIIKKELQERGISQKVFAKALKLCPSHLSEIINGKRPIPDALIPQIASFVGMQTDQIVESQANMQFQNKKRAMMPQEDVDAEKVLRQYDELVCVKSLLRGMSSRTKTPRETLSMVKGYYNLPVPEVLSHEFENLGQRCFRRSAKNGLDTRMISTWVIKAKKIVGEKPITGTYDSEKNEDLAQKLSNVFHTNVDTINRVGSLLDAYGFGFGVVKKEEHASIDGYSFFANGHPYIVVTQRFDRIDNLAFTVLHELGHIVLGHTSTEQAMLSLEENPHDFEFIDNKEVEADKFATDALIPESVWCLTPKVSLNPYAIQKKFTEWARERHLNEWIVLGRVSHETGMYMFKSNKCRTIN